MAIIKIMKLSPYKYIFGALLASFLLAFAGTATVHAGEDFTFKEFVEKFYKDYEEKKKDPEFVKSMSVDNSTPDADPLDYAAWKKAHKNFLDKQGDLRAYSDDKKGCSNKMSNSYIVLKKYKEGATEKELAKLMRRKTSEMETLYKDIRKNGVEKAQKEMMEEYSECIRTASSAGDPGDEYDMDMHYGNCGKLSTILMRAADDIKNRRSADYIFSEYKSKDVDLSETAYKSIKDPVMFFVGSMYKKSKQGGVDGYKSAVDYASKISLGCTM